MGIRHLFLLLGYLGLVVAYTIRVVLSVAIVVMVREPKEPTNDTGINATNWTDVENQSTTASWYETTTTAPLKQHTCPMVAHKVCSSSTHIYQPFSLLPFTLLFIPSIRFSFSFLPSGF